LISEAIIRTSKHDYRHFNRVPSRKVQLGYQIIALLHNITVVWLNRPSQMLLQRLKASISTPQKFQYLS